MSASSAVALVEDGRLSALPVQRHERRTQYGSRLHLAACNRTPKVNRLQIAIRGRRSAAGTRYCVLSCRMSAAT